MFRIKGDDIIEKFFDGVILLVGIGLLFGGNIIAFSRIVKISIPWAQEFLVDCFVWLLFFGAAFSSKKWLISVSIIDDTLASKRKGTLYKVVRLIQIFATLAFAVLSAYFTYVYAFSQLDKGVTSTTMNFKTGYFTLGVAVALTLMSIYQCVKAVIYLVKPGKDLLPASDDASEVSGDSAT